jgi:hypothetical protein
MPYYPKSQVKTNLYTNGTSPTLYKIEDQTIYTGYYHLLSNGKYFSGKTPQDTPSFELTTFTRTSFPSPITLNSVPVYPVLTPEGTEIYVSYPNDFSSQEYPKFQSPTRLVPVYNPNIPTPEDYKIGEFRRYFCKRTNEIKYTEIDKNTFDLLLNQSPTIEYTLFLPFYLDWQLTGNEEQVARVNKNNAELTAQRLRLPGLLEYLRFDFTKYYKP